MVDVADATVAFQQMLVIYCENSACSWGHDEDDQFCQDPFQFFEMNVCEAEGAHIASQAISGYQPVILISSPDFRC